jgi:hypothetical protein
VEQFDFGRADLSRDLQQDDRETISLNLIAPAIPGDYIVRIDLVNEGICWFEDEGSRTIDVRLHVV